MTGLYVQRAHSHEVMEPVSLVCNQAIVDLGESKPPFPHTHYLFSSTYGWFDNSHFNTGHPGQVIVDVETAVAHGGGTITIKQGVRDDITGYTATYHVSGNLTKTEVMAATLGIYLDWSMRFEAWQARPPHGLVGPLTPFAVEDLPSQYLGFYAQAHDLTIGELFACYLGPISGSEEGPPDIVMSKETVEADGWAGIARLQNKAFTPLVQNEAGWQRIDWPEALRMEPISGGPNTWLFVSEETWYLNDEMPAFLVESAPDDSRVKRPLPHRETAVLQQLPPVNVDTSKFHSHHWQMPLLKPGMSPK